MLIKQPYITIPFNGEIWRLEIDEATATLLLEVRSESEKLVCFASVDLQSGKLNFSDYTTPERWLTGMETAHNGVLLLHHYLSEKGPVHKGIVAVDVTTAGILWSNYNLAFDHLSVNGPVVYNTQLLPKKLYLAGIKTGENIRPYNPVIDEEPVKNIAVPHMLAPDQFPAELPAAPYGNMIHYLEHNNYRIVSLHTHNGKTLNQHLYIMDGPDVVYEDLLNTDIQKMQPEAFVLHKNWLICLKNKTGLLVLDI
ncbi:MAG: DUF4905 domain-containing protein [Mucilaginibacter sp.]